PRDARAECSRWVSCESTVAATKVKERLPVTDPRTLDAADEDRVVAFDVGVHGRALDVRQGTLDERQGEIAQLELDTLELVEPSRGEAPRSLHLFSGQNVDGEAAALAQRGIALRLVIHADEYERRIEGHRRERAGGEAGRTMLGVARADDGDT